MFRQLAVRSVKQFTKSTYITKSLQKPTYTGMLYITVIAPYIPPIYHCLAEVLVADSRIENIGSEIQDAKTIILIYVYIVMMSYTMKVLKLFT